MNKYYIPFVPAADVNYLYLFELYDKADFNTDTKTFDTITYTSKKELVKSLSFSYSTLNRILKDADYSYFLSNSESKITLHNNFTAASDKKIPFVCLTAAEVKYLRQHADTLLCRYYIYLKYYCGFMRYKGGADFTTNQFFYAIGYSTTSNSMRSKISQYNTMLKDDKMISVSSCYDTQGHLRNTYTMK